MSDCNNYLENLLKITNVRRNLEAVAGHLEKLRIELGGRYLFIPEENMNDLEELIRILIGAEKSILFQMYEKGCITPEV